MVQIFIHHYIGLLFIWEKNVNMSRSCTKNIRYVYYIITFYYFLCQFCLGILYKPCVENVRKGSCHPTNFKCYSKVETAATDNFLIFNAKSSDWIFILHRLNFSHFLSLEYVSSTIQFHVVSVNLITVS